MDAYGDEWKDSDEESELEEDSAPLVFKPSYVLIAIDTADSMFATNGSNQSPFADCLDACYQVANSLVMADRGAVKGPVGIVLAHNESGRASFVEFEHPIPDTVKLLKDLKTQPNDELQLKYKRKTDFDLADFFLFCKNKLLSVNAEVYKRTVLYITNDDNPIQDDPRKRFKIINESQKFPSVQMDLNVVTFKTDFDSTSLYSEVLLVSNSPPVENVSSVNLSDKISTLVQKKYTKYKSKFYPFRGDTERYFEVVVNKFIKSSNISKNMYVTRDTQQEVKKSIKQQENTGSYSIKYSKSDPPIMISEKEKEVFGETDLPIGYTFLCVGEETLKRDWVIEAPSLMEKHYTEAQPIYDSFWQFCKDKSRCVICLRKYKKCGDVRVVELVPKFINNTCMFLVKVMPFGPEIGMPSLPAEEVSFEQEEEDAMTALVDVLTFDFDPHNFIDPVYGKKKAYIKSQLLGEPMEEIPDMMPSDSDMDKRVAAQVNVLQRLNLVDKPGASGAGKRSWAPKSAGPQKRKKEA